MSYSDLVIIPRSSVSAFIRYCGIFAAMNLFVEVAIPTAMILSRAKIVTERNGSWKGTAIWFPEQIEKLLNDHKRSLTSLFTHFGKEQLYIHPIKLSQWIDDLRKSEALGK